MSWLTDSLITLRWKARIAWGLLNGVLRYFLCPQPFLVTAAEAMWRLNRYARRVGSRWHSKPVYDLKNRFVRMLYEYGFCHAVTEVRQIFPCWGFGEQGCRGAGCLKCGGTGIYRTVILYCFTFVVGGRRFVWHQPRDLVTWPVRVTDVDDEPYQSNENVVRRRDKKSIGRDIVTVWLVLRLCHNPQMALPGVLDQDDGYRRIPFPVDWYERQGHTFRLGRVRVCWLRIEHRARRAWLALLKRFWRRKYEEWDYIPF